ncbi:MAG: hypothetical protein LBQ67_08420 [Treponema sp.]|jgi:hypothetical protein|nr:hypothetical protein [Treponema sp.]
MDKHINFFELQKAAEKPGCPLCRIAADRARRYIDNMLFEHVSDRGFRARYRAAGGFCGFHARGLEAFRDGLAVAILGRDILEDRIDAFRKLKPWRPKSPCPVCEEQARIEEEYLGFLAGTGEAGPQTAEPAKEENEFRAVFTASDGLCAPHYARLLLTPRGKARSVPLWLKDFQETKFRDLLARAGRFIELSAYGRQEEFASLPESDKLVWKELARSLRGPEA